MIYCLIKIIFKQVRIQSFWKVGSGHQISGFFFVLPVFNTYILYTVQQILYDGVKPYVTSSPSSSDINWGMTFFANGIKFISAVLTVMGGKNSNPDRYSLLEYYSSSMWRNFRPIPSIWLYVTSNFATASSVPYSKIRQNFSSVVAPPLEDWDRPSAIGSKMYK